MGVVKRFKKKYLKEKAIFWEQKGTNADSYDQYELPVEIVCRWTNKSIQDLDTEGKETIFQSRVFVDREMKVGDVIKLGEVKDLAGPLPPPEEAKRIRKFDDFPDKNATDSWYTAYL